MATKFFKIVINPRDPLLRIPTEFIKRYGQDLPNKVTLKAPNGPIREVEVFKSNGETWLKEGWLKFKEYYSIDAGYLLVFEFDGESHFNVLIFDTSAVEIQYALENDDDGSESDDSVIFLKDYSTRKGKEAQCVGTQCSQKKQLPRVISERCIAYKKAVDFMSDNPCHISVMQPSYVTNNFNLNVPLPFAIEYFPEKITNVTLRALDGRTWSVRCNIGTRSAKITCGWRKFVEDNDLKVGDVCVFEVIKSSEHQFIWNVIIFNKEMKHH